jgi:hypothetical protein
VNTRRSAIGWVIHEAGKTTCGGSSLCRNVNDAGEAGATLFVLGGWALIFTVFALMGIIARVNEPDAQVEALARIVQ